MPVASISGMRGNRTATAALRSQTGFEDRPGHQAHAFQTLRDSPANHVFSSGSRAPQFYRRAASVSLSEETWASEGRKKVHLTHAKTKETPYLPRRQWSSRLGLARRGGLRGVAGASTSAMRKERCSPWPPNPPSG